MNPVTLTPPGSRWAARGHEGSVGPGADPERQRAVTQSRPPAPARGRTPSLLDELGGEPTLDELLTGVWEGLAAHRAVACPVCGEVMKPAYGAHAKPIGGRCEGCGAALS